MGIERYAGRVALVTGASSGIGAGIAQELLRQGVNVVGLARRVDRVQALELKDSPGKLYALKGDVSSEESILSAFKWIKENLKGVDILINSAGIDYDDPLTSSPTEDWREMLDVNVLGLSVCTREAVKDMRSRGVDDGFIIHISSIAAHIPAVESGTAMHSANKAAVNILTEGLRKELSAQKSKIRVGQISPGYVKTDAVNNLKTLTPEMLAKMPYMEPEDMGKAVVYMLSQDIRVQIHDIIIRPTCDTYG